MAEDHWHTEKRQEAKRLALRKVPAYQHLAALAEGDAVLRALERALTRNTVDIEAMG